MGDGVGVLQGGHKARPYPRHPRPDVGRPWMEVPQGSDNSHSLIFSREKAGALAGCESEREEQGSLKR